jgi:hypothetical protein
MVTDTQSTVHAFEQAFPLADHPAGIQVNPNPDAYPYTYFRAYGDSWRQAREEVTQGKSSVTLSGMWIDGTPGTIAVSGTDGAWRLSSRTPQGKGLAA